MSLKLYTNDKTSPSTVKVLVAAKYAGVEVAVHADGHPKNVTDVPLGRLPVLETSEGLVVGADAAARYGMSILFCIFFLIVSSFHIDP